MFYSILLRSFTNLDHIYKTKVNRHCDKHRGNERTLKRASNLVGLGKVIGVNDDHGSQLGIPRGGGAVLA